MPPLAGTFEFTDRVVPEPSTVFLLGAGLAGLSAMRVRGQRKRDGGEIARIS